MCSVKVSENVLTSIAASVDGSYVLHPTCFVCACANVSVVCRTVYVGDGKGYVLCYDTRTMEKVGALKGLGGSCKSICPHPSLPLVASCGLDRYCIVGVCMCVCMSLCLSLCLCL